MTEGQHRPFSRLLAVGQRYVVYASIGVLVALATIMVRAVLGRLLPADTPVFYALSIIGAYLTGMTLSYLGHRKVTFGHVEDLAHSWQVSVASYVSITLVGLGVTLLVSMLVRYQLPLQQWVGDWASTLAFVAGVLVSSTLTFLLNQAVTFKSRH